MAYEDLSAKDLSAKDMVVVDVDGHIVDGLPTPKRILSFLKRLEKLVQFPVHEILLTEHSRIAA